MRKFFARLYRGMCYSEKYGEHPGTIWLIVFVIMGLAGDGRVFPLHLRFGYYCGYHYAVLLLLFCKT